MKYLKRFNESNTDDVIENVKDILLPINDMGYNISVTEDEDNFQLIIRVVTYIDKPLLITDEIKEEFIRMKDYLVESEGYKSIEVRYHTTSQTGLKSGIDDFINRFETDIRFGFKDLRVRNLLFIAKQI